MNLNKKETTEFYANRGILYVQVKQMENALADFGKVEVSHSMYPEVAYYKALALEEQKKYDEELKLYKELFLTTDNIIFLAFAEVVKRKKSEKK
jgi:tetratricopeptide (TPR) repeat protein